MNSNPFDKLNRPFESFWMGGYECADHVNVHGDRVDMLKLTGHLSNIDNDYQLLKEFGIKSVREGISWVKTEVSPYTYDFAHVSLMMDAAEKHGIQQVWDICHFGYPSDLTPLHPHFKDRFVALCKAFVEFYLSKQSFTYPLIVTPINEVSFISWLGGEVAGTAPFCRGKGWDVKYELMKAYIAGVSIMKNSYPEILIMSTEPLINIVPPLSPTEEMERRALDDNSAQFQSNDMLCGRICPELGGREEYLDIVGLNFYYNNQFGNAPYEILPWLNEVPDPRWRPLQQMLSDVAHHYNRPLALAETSHPGEDRAKWITFVTSQCKLAILNGVPLIGVCIYPIVDRPDWDDIGLWHNSGLWSALDVDRTTRDIEEEYAIGLSNCQNEIANIRQVV